ncbi:MAG: YceI family protein, partial [Candidatus Methylomirabilales bacterium]
SLMGPGALASDITHLTVVPEKSHVTFTVPYSFLNPARWVIGVVEGRLNVRSGDARVSFTHPNKGASAEVVIDPSSLNTGNGWRDGILKKEHFEVEKYPEIRFKMTELKSSNRSSSPEISDLFLRGFLTCHGVIREITVPAHAVRRDKQVTVDGEAAVRMTDFKMPLPEFGLFLKSHDDVKLKFHLVLEAVKG